MVDIDPMKIALFSIHSIESGQKTYENVKETLGVLLPKDMFDYVMECIDIYFGSGEE